MKKRKNLKTLAAIAMVLALGLGAVAIAFHSHQDNMEHPECALCYAQQVFSTVVLCLAPILALRQVLSTVVPRQRAMVPVTPVFIPNSPRSPPCSFQLSDP